MSILRDAIQQLKINTGFNLEYDSENIIFHSERLQKILNNSKPLKREDKDLLFNALAVLQTLAQN